MVLVVASPAGAIVRHVHRIVVEIGCLHSERVGQCAPNLLLGTARDTEQVCLADKFLVTVIQDDIEAIVFRVETGALVSLVLPDVHPTPAAMVGLAVLVRDIFRRYAFGGLLFGYNDLIPANVVLHTSVL
ncbi:uncharacterized protein EI97DRAFT_298107 [Westerdykella ornata]|uniref:Uncharacterized protein n=1 Tax=Westerdykella ornata TaxID=318751 RepID=A0A6A6JPH6_WESOR|nr:uncharacterized protein EI97DRAFT_298107 [Westerdykella ornata]KAF2277576.1 hypothetical protein EI97DRAFT_298107 [Westerdykella ornata]